jgi:MFS family permease
MPKPKPDEVIRHEIVLGRAEREIVRDLQLSYTANRLLSPFTNLSASGALFLTGSGLLLLDYLLDNIGLDPDWKAIIADMTPEGVKDWFETQNLVLGGIGAIIGALLGGPLGAAVGGVAGGVVAEVGEDIAGAGVDHVTGQVERSNQEREEFQNRLWLGLLQFRATLGIVAATPDS